MSLDNTFPSRITQWVNSSVNEDGTVSAFVEDKAETLRVFYNMWGNIAVSAFTKRVESLFSDKESDCIILSTIHRAKGDEASRVFILQSNCLPYYDRCNQPWQRSQERNLQYVALTRSKEELFFVPFKGPFDKEEDIKKAIEDPYGGMRFL